MSSDHWWRDSAGYDGQTDRREPLILKAPGHSRGARYGTAFNTLITPQLLLAILKMEITCADDILP